MKPVVLAAILWCGWAASAVAQVTHEVPFARNLHPDRMMVVTTAETVAGARRGGYGWVQVDIKNPDSQPHEFLLVITEAYSRISKYESERRFVLEPLGHTTQFLPLPMLARPMKLVCSVDGYERGSVQHRIDVEERSYGVGGLLVTDHSSEHAAWEDLIKHEMMFGFPKQTVRRWVRGKQKTETLSPLQRFPHRTGTSLPPQWQMLSAFDFVVIDGRSVSDASAQVVLAEYVQAGGSALLYHAEHLDGDSELRRAFARHGAGRHGLGKYYVHDGAMPFQDERRRGDINDWFGGANDGVLAAHKKDRSIPLAEGVYWNEQIPGLGDIPVGLFFLVLLVFSVLAGPFNYFYWKRQRRMAMLLITVPAAGFGVTAVILLAGLLSEGLGVKGCVASVSVLDQAKHEAVTWSVRELYAGLTPGELTPDQRTFVTSRNVVERPHWRQPVTHVMQVDLDHGSALGGQLIPARYESGVTTASIRTVRDRIRFRARGDGNLEALVGPEFSLRSAGGHSIVFCDFDGDFYAAGGDGLLRPVSEQEGRERARALVRTNSSSTPAPDVVEMISGLPPGSYVAACDRNPCMDDLGLSVEWLRHVHTVIGTIAPEDLVRD